MALSAVILSLVGLTGPEAAVVVLFALAGYCWALFARAVPPTRKEMKVAPADVNLGILQTNVERHCDKMDELCDAEMDDEVLRSLEQDFGGQTTLDDQLDLDLALDALCEEAMGATGACVLKALEDEFAGSNNLNFKPAPPPPAPAADSDCDFDRACDLAMDDQHDAVLKNLESEVDGPSEWDDDPQLAAFCVRGVEQVLSVQAEEKLAAEASALSIDNALDIAFEEYTEQLLAESEPAGEAAHLLDEQMRCSLLQIVMGKVRRAWALYLWWVI